MFQVFPVKTGILENNFNLSEILAAAFKKNRIRLQDGDILVVSSKILALSQGRVVRLKNVRVTKEAKKLAGAQFATGREEPEYIQLILNEADAILPGKIVTVIKDGNIIPAAGIDRSNVPAGHAILWPKNSWEEARKLWKKLRNIHQKNAAKSEQHRLYKFKRLGIIICDSRCQPLRFGTTGLALAWAGFCGVEDARQKRDIYGQKLIVTRKAVADNLASSALLVMGEAGERIPFALIRGAPVHFTLRQQEMNEVHVPPDECIFRGIYSKNAMKLLKKLDFIG